METILLNDFSRAAIAGKSDNATQAEKAAAGLMGILPGVQSRLRKLPAQQRLQFLELLNLLNSEEN